MPKLLNPCVDPIFKALFTDNSEDAHKALTSFLSAVLNQTVSDVKLSTIELPAESDNERQTFFDLTCVLDGKEPVNIEMQGINIYETFDMRVEYHVAHLLNHFVKKGTQWSDIPKAYQISVLNFIYDDSHNDLCSHYYMQADNGSSLSRRLNIFFIELPKVIKKTDNVSELSKIELWSKFFAYAGDESKQGCLAKITEAEDGIMSANTVLNKISLDDAMWIQQNHYYEALAREATLQGGYEKGVARGMEKGFQQGMEKGMQQGLQQGLQQGMQQGMQQGLQQGIEIEQKNSIINLLLAHAGSEEQIAAWLKLPLEHVHAVAAEISQKD